MSTIKVQLNKVKRDLELNNRVFFIDFCAIDKTLEGCKFRLLKQSREGVELLNLIEDDIEIVSPNLKCVISVQ